MNSPGPCSSSCLCAAADKWPSPPAEGRAAVLHSCGGCDLWPAACIPDWALPAAAPASDRTVCVSRDNQEEYSCPRLVFFFPHGDLQRSYPFFWAAKADFPQLKRRLVSVFVCVNCRRDEGQTKEKEGADLGWGSSHGEPVFLQQHVNPAGLLCVKLVCVWKAFLWPVCL